MVEQFDPHQLRHDLLRRMAEVEAPPRPHEPGVLEKCAQELQRWFYETSIARLCMGIRGRHHGDTTSLGEDPPAGASFCMVTTNESNSSSGSDWSAPATATNSHGGPLHRAVTVTEIVQGGGFAHCVSMGRSASAQCLPVGFPARAICRHLGAALSRLRHDIQVMLFLTFPSGSPYHDRTVEALFQWHYNRWWNCLDWSTVALILMLVWDVAMNPPYRVTLVLLFYAAFATGLLLRKVLLFAAPSPPRHRRVWHNFLLCAFFFGRCVVCQPLLVNFALQGRPFRALQVEAFSSVIGLGMTNLSMVFMQQMQTIDMLLFCVVNGVVFILWIIVVLKMPLTDALHTAYVGSIVVTAVCVRQQRDLEDIERRTFDHELIHARGALVRSAERIAGQASPHEFAAGMGILNRARRFERLNF